MKFKLIMKNGKPFGRELNPYGEVEYKLIASGLGFMSNPKFKQWSDAEHNLKEFEIDESQYDGEIMAWDDTDKTIKFAIKRLNVGDVFNANLIGNKLFDLTV